MFDRIAFIVGEALQALRRNTWMTFAAVTTSATALFMLGGLFYTYISLNRVAENLSTKIEIRAFIKDDLTQDEMKQAGEAIRAIPGVKKAIWISKKDNWEAYKKRFPKSLVESVENPLPNIFIVQATDTKDTQRIAEAIQKIPAIETDGVKYRNDAQEFIQSSLKKLRIFGYGLGILLLFTSGILIYNTIRLTIVARYREIRIMRLVGATRITVMLPMLIEGLIQGALGGIAGTLLVYGADRAYRNWLGSELAAVWPTFPLASCLFYLVALGSVYGFICSTWALRDMRKAR
ncbi:MAG: ABC transporter permease [Armatimonadetes bacterium]|nr:ABC transporter permease [Armatimonadota bacterium]